MTQEIIYDNNVDATLKTIIEGGNYNDVMVLVDENTRRLVLPRLNCLKDAHIIEIPCGDESKNFETLTTVWKQMENCGATRYSLLVNLGGGVVTDLGGLAAAIFKRGIHFINVPTTLLAAVDAAVGGKTGINFMGLKNEIGLFACADIVIVSTCFFDTLPLEELKSGYAEMLKHGMLSGHSDFMELMENDISSIKLELMLNLLRKSVAVKQYIVSQDPKEQGLRKALNLGHTVGHAFESKALADRAPVPHGYAVAWGLVVETVLSHMLKQFPSQDLYSFARFVRDNYGVFYITCDDYDDLIALMRHDKKSCSGEINCTLLTACGDVSINNIVSDQDIKAALDIYRDLMGI
jgi:3-dehydroquinate synthase